MRLRLDNSMVSESAMCSLPTMRSMANAMAMLRPTESPTMPTAFPARASCSSWRIFSWLRLVRTATNSASSNNRMACSRQGYQTTVPYRPVSVSACRLVKAASTSASVMAAPRAGSTHRSHSRHWPGMRVASSGASCASEKARQSANPRESESTKHCGRKLDRAIPVNFGAAFPRMTGSPPGCSRATVNPTPGFPASRRNLFETPA